MPLYKKFAKIIRKELDTYRESMTFYEMECFVGAVIADLLHENLITRDESIYLRRYVLDETHPYVPSPPATS